MTSDDLSQLIVLAGVLYIFGAAIWVILWWHAETVTTTTSARMVLATPVWPIAALVILLPMAYTALVRLIIEAKIGGHR